MAGIDLGPLDPTSQRLGATSSNSPTRRRVCTADSAGLLPAPILIHPHRPITGLLVVLPWCWHSSVSLWDQSLRWIQGGSRFQSAGMERPVGDVLLEPLLADSRSTWRPHRLPAAPIEVLAKASACRIGFVPARQEHRGEPRSR